MYQVLIHLALVTGCRRGELVALKWEEIDFDNGIVFVRHSAYKLTGEAEKLKEPKRGSNRNIAIPEYLVDMLRTYHKEQIERQLKIGSLWHDEGFLFTQWNGEEMDVTTPTHWWPSFLKRHNLPHIKFHALRHSSATLLLSPGENIKAVASRLGHRQLSTTNRYVHALHSADKAAADTFQGMFGKKNRFNPAHSIIYHSIKTK
jgi:integrase